MSVPCRYYQQGRCRAGASCTFAHVGAVDAPNTGGVILGAHRIPCRFDQAGHCHKGAGCPFKHKDRPAPASAPARRPAGATVAVVPRGKTFAVAQPAWRPQPAPQAAVPVVHTGLVIIDDDEDPEEQEPAAGNAPVQVGPGFSSVLQENLEEAPAPVQAGEALRPGGKAPAGQRVICPFYASGNCRFGDRCRNVHGEPCPVCGRNVLDPADDAGNAKHIERCARRQPSEDIECGVCYEKPLAMSRRFGILTGCDHAFCLSCIREWRDKGQAVSTGMARACPLCRTLSHFVVPSDYFVGSGDDKETLIAEYQAKLATIPCKHFNYGQGTCPFGTSCFYAHLNADGTAADQTPRMYLDDEGNVRYDEPARISDLIPL